MTEMKLLSDDGWNRLKALVRSADGLAWVAMVESERTARKEAETALAEARGLVIEANNSLYGSQGYFHSLNGGSYDRFHLATGIEALKQGSNALLRRAEKAEADAMIAARATEREAG